MSELMGRTGGFAPRRAEPVEPPPRAAGETRPAFERSAFDLKGTVAQLTVLKLRTDDLEWIERDLTARVTQMPELFCDAPVVIDGGPLGDGDALSPLIRLLREAKMLPVAVVGGSDDLRETALACGLGILAPNALRNRPERAPTVAPPPAPEPVVAQPAFREVRTVPGDDTTAPSVPIPEAPAASSLTIKQPVRGGQVIYAQKADLVVLAAVNAGAQVIADGNIHIYGPLRGRALAGAKGNPDARIFCRSLEAELISIRGEYMLFDEIPMDRRGKACQIQHEHGEFRIIPL